LQARPGNQGVTALLPAVEPIGGTLWGPGTVHVDAMDHNGYTAPAHHPNVVAPFKQPRTTISPSPAAKSEVFPAYALAY
jgi:gamma-glutamyltranspeptidase/glutathione hydrolase